MTSGVRNMVEQRMIPHTYKTLLVQNNGAGSTSLSLNKQYEHLNNNTITIVQRSQFLITAIRSNNEPVKQQRFLLYRTLVRGQGEDLTGSVAIVRQLTELHLVDVKTALVHFRDQA